MKTGKLGLMVGVATVALMSGAMAQEASAERPIVLAQADTTSRASNADLAARVQALEDALASQGDRATADRTRLSTLEQNFNYASWTYDNGRPVIQTGDGRFQWAFRLRFQSDFASFAQEDTHPAGFAGPADLSTGAVIRRAYFGVEGRAYNDFAFELRLNLGGSNGGFTGTGVTAGEGDPLLNKAVISYVGIPGWHINVGVLEPAFMFEGTTSSAQLMFLERPEIDNIAADLYGAGDSRRGIEIGYAKSDALWAGDNLAITAIFSGQKTGNAAGHGNGGDEPTQLLGRISDRLWSDGISNLSIGMSAATILYSGNAAGGGSQSINLQERPQVRVDGTRLITTGGIPAKTGDMIAFDLGGNWENFFLGGEWAQFSVDRQCGGITALGNPVCTSTTAVIDHPTFSGWYIEGSWILTGETKTYTANALNNETGGFQGPVPSRPFSLNGGSWGAWEVVARYAVTDLNWHETQAAGTGQLAGILGGEQRVVALGLNWYLNRNVRLMIDDNIVSVKKGIASNLGRDSQNFNVLAVRVQFAN